MYARILVPLDGSATAQRGLAEAIALAGRLGSTLHLLNVVDARYLVADASLYAPPTQLLGDWQAAGEKLLTDAVAQAQAKGVKTDSIVVCDPGQRVCDLILAEARKTGAELIVMGTHGRRGFSRLTLGSDAELVLRESPVPVLLIRVSEAEAAA
jgi:nucleotide-binding universal stress UspA family protein